MSNQKSTNKIKILPDFIANQIAAGEVVQRPESVIKELVENSLDAGANSIAVIVRDAGKKLIHVVDDGNGISEEDLPLTIKRHATSKIVSSEDLEAIYTYGFRGEALASIAAVAQLEIRTKQKEEELGLKLVSEPNKEHVTEPVMTDNGTQIFIRNLFYNVPARRKFLRSNITEFRYISDTMLKFAIINPDKRFTFYDDDTLIFDVKPQDWEERIKALLGNSAEDNLMQVEFENEFLTLEGFSGDPGIAKPSKSMQFLYLNNRPIQSKSIAHAIYSVYENLLDKNYHPLFILNIKFDPHRVDVNVHPQKHEVKFDDERYIYNNIKRAVHQTLNRYHLIPDIDFESDIIRAPFERMNPGGNSIVNTVTGEVYNKGDFSGPYEQGGYSGPKEYRHYEVEVNRPDKSAFDILFGDKVESEFIESSSEFDINKGNQKYIIFRNKFIILPGIEHLQIIHIGKAYRQIQYNKALKALESDRLPSQNLLFHEPFSINLNQKNALSKLEEKLKRLGFNWELNDAEVTIKTVPDGITGKNEKDLFIEFLDSYDENSGGSIENLNKKMAMIYAGKTSNTTSNLINEHDVRYILSELKKAGEGSYFTKKPAMINLLYTQVEKLFE